MNERHLFILLLAIITLLLVVASPIMLRTGDVDAQDDGMLSFDIESIHIEAEDYPVERCSNEPRVRKSEPRTTP